MRAARLGLALLLVGLAAAAALPSAQARRALLQGCKVSSTAVATR